MIERILENWLDNSIEHTFQIPFCYMLSNEGYTIIHISDHCPIEMGKDIIAIDKEGIPCAFQLKGSKKITLSRWRNNIQPQIDALQNDTIVHPSIESNKPHKSFFVTNGELDEYVIREIDDRNREWEKLGHPEKKLNTIVRGEILKKAKRLNINLWPQELSEIRVLLELFLLNGDARLPKEKFANLFKSILKITNPKTRKPSKSKVKSVVSSCALLCSIALSSFSNKRNYVAEIEGWVIFLSYTFAYLEKWKIPKKLVNDSIKIAEDAIYNSLSLLCNEIMENKYLVVGDILSDKPVYTLRVTLLVALMSVYGLWREIKDDVNDLDDSIRDFCKSKISYLSLWGEAAVPQFLAYFWYIKSVDVIKEAYMILFSLIKTFIKKKDPKNDDFLANPYYNENEIIPHLLKIPNINSKINFTENSYALESLIHLIVRRNFKQLMKQFWPDISRLGFISFYPEEKWQYYLWRCEKGKNINKYPELTKEWQDLKGEVENNNYDNLPEILKEEFIYFLLFLIVFPHRMRADAIKWIDDKLWKI